MSSSGDITRLLAAISRGDPVAESQLVELVYKDLHTLARRYMRRERSDHTLQPTALVHETYMRLMRKAAAPLDRVHFFATASTVMRHVLVDHATARKAAKRGGPINKVELDDFLVSATPSLDQWLILDEALVRLAAMDSRQVKLVEMVFFSGLTLEEAANLLGISDRTAKRDWRAAKAWLKAELKKTRSGTTPTCDGDDTDATKST